MNDRALNDRALNDRDGAREGLLQVMHPMHASGLNRGTSGNASIRVAGGMMVTPSGIPPDALTPASMVFVADDATPDPGGLVPSSEELLWRSAEALSTMFQLQPESRNNYYDLLKSYPSVRRTQNAIYLYGAA